MSDTKKLLSSHDKAFVGEVYHRYSQRLYFECKRFTNDMELSRDCVHEAFKVLIETAPSFKNMKQVHSWLLVTARNIARQKKRKDRNIVFFGELEELAQNANSDAESFSLEEVIADDSLEQRLAEENNFEVLGKCMSEQDFQLTLLLYKYGCSIEEAAVRLNIPIRTMYRRVNRVNRIIMRKKHLLSKIAK